jgi:dienelactone hydrolase
MTTATTATTAAAPALTLALLASFAAGKVVSTPVEYAVDGATHRGTLVYDDERVSADAPAPGVVVVHEWWGPNAYAHHRAEMLAELGYVAFVADMYGLDESGSVRVVETPGEAQALAMPLYQDRSIMRARAAAAVAALRDSELSIDDDLAAIGYCFGGSVVLELARAGAELDAVVAFHGGLSAADGMALQEDAFAGTILVCHGNADEFVSPAEKLGFFVEMNAAKADYVFVEYAAAVHAFTNPEADAVAQRTGLPSVGYNEAADRRSWQHMQDLFAEAFAD